MTIQNKRLCAIVLIIALLLLTPLVAMQFSREVSWTSLDFIAAAALLLGAGGGCELVLRKVKRRRQRLAVCGAILGVLVLAWLELAVGIFGTPFGGS